VGGLARGNGGRDAGVRAALAIEDSYHACLALLAERDLGCRARCEREGENVLSIVRSNSGEVGVKKKKERFKCWVWIFWVSNR